MKKKRKQNMRMNTKEKSVKKSWKKKKLPLNVPTTFNVRQRIEANTKSNMKMYVKKNAKVKPNTILQMGDCVYCYALAARQLSNVWWCPGPNLVMSCDEAHLLTVSGDRDEQCK
jgi:hypothetical protein